MNENKVKRMGNTPGMIKAWYSHGGSLVTMQPIHSGQDKLNGDVLGYYGANYLVAESIDIETALIICQGLNLDFMGILCNQSSKKKVAD